SPRALALLRTALRQGGVGRRGCPAGWPLARAAPVAGPGQPRPRLCWPACVILGAPRLAAARGPGLSGPARNSRLVRRGPGYLRARAGSLIGPPFQGGPKPAWPGAGPRGAGGGTPPPGGRPPRSTRRDPAPPPAPGGPAPLWPP